MQIILGMDGCSRCKMLRDQHPEVQYLELSSAELLAIAKPLGIKSMPIVVQTEEDIKL